MPITIKPLEYSEETLNKRLKSVRFINIQGARDVVINLPPSGVVRLHASSEVGKSSLLKPFEALVTTKYNTKREIESLVTKGCNTGELICELINGTFVALHLDTTNMNKCCYGIQYPGKPLEQLPYPQGLPKILEVLGWYTTGLNDKLDFSLNVRLKGVLPIVDTPKRLNTEIFNVALNDEELENMYSKVNLSLDSVNEDINKLSRVLEGAKFTLNNLKVEDIEPLKNELVVLEHLAYEDGVYEQLESSLTDIFTSVSSKPKKVTLPREVPSLIEQFSLFSKMEQSLSSILQSEKPVLKTVPSHLKGDIDLFKDIHSITSELSRILTMPKVTLKEVDKNISNDIQLFGAVQNVTNNLKTIIESEKPIVKKINKEEIKDLLNTYSTCSRLETSLTGIVDLITEKPVYNELCFVADKMCLTLAFVETCISELKTSKDSLNNIHEEMKKYQCPTCGQYAKGKHIHL